MKKLITLFGIIACFNINAQVSSIAGGNFFSLKICSDHTIESWGDNSFGQLGDGGTIDSHVPIHVSNLTGVIAVAAGMSHSIALKSDGSAWSWGSNLQGELGIATYSNSSYRVRITSLGNNITAISAGGNYSLFLKNDGTVWASGKNTYGELGNGSNTSTNAPVQVSLLTGIIAISAGCDGHSLALKNDGTVWAWGYNCCGQLGTGNNIDSNIPIKITGLSGITAIAAGGYYSLVLKNNGIMYSFGNNYEGELGNGTNTGTNIPVAINSLTGVAAISAGTLHSLALKNDGTVWTFGNNSYGELGNGTNVNSNLPVLVNSLAGVTAIEGGGSHSIVLKNDDSTWTWGQNASGELGYGTFTDSNIPLHIIGVCSSLISVNELTTSSTISIYPNPAYTDFTIETNSPTTEFLQVFDITGKVVLSREIQNGKSIIDISALQQGIYNVNITGKESSANKRLVIVK